MNKDASSNKTVLKDSSISVKFHVFLIRQFDAVVYLCLKQMCLDDFNLSHTNGQDYSDGIQKMIREPKIYISLNNFLQIISSRVIEWYTYLEAMNEKLICRFKKVSVMFIPQKSYFFWVGTIRVSIFQLGNQPEQLK